MALKRYAHLRSSLAAYAIIGGLSAAVTSCELSQNASVQPVNHSGWVGCRITSRTVTYTNQTPAFVMKSDWTYNEKGLLTQYDNPQSFSPYPYRVNYTYDETGYLITSTEHYIMTGFVGYAYDTITTAYTYANGRLSKETNKYEGVIDYEYDQSGELTKIVNRTGLYGDSKTYLFSVGKLIDYSVIYEGTNAEAHPYELNDGQIVREYARDRRYYTNYQYDDLGRPTLIERVDGDKVTEYYTYAYTDGKAYFDAIPLPKGWPAINRKKFIYDNLFFGSSVVPTGLPVNYSRYLPKIGSTDLYQNATKDYAYTKNSENFPVRSVYSTTVFSPSGQTVGSVSPVIESNTYEGCQ